MASGLVYYTISQADVDLLAQIGAGRRVRRLPVAPGEEYAAMVVRSPIPEVPGDQSWADLLVFIDGTQPYFKRQVGQGTGSGQWSAARQQTVVG